MKKLGEVCAVLLLAACIGCAGVQQAAKYADWGPLGQYGHYYDPKAVENVEGRVETVLDMPYGEDPSLGSCLALEIKTELARHLVFLGPKSYFDKKGLYFETGQVVAVTGSNVTVCPKVDRCKHVTIAKAVSTQDTVVAIRDESGHHL